MGNNNNKISNNNNNNNVNDACTCNKKQIKIVICTICESDIQIEKPNIECCRDCVVHKSNVAICGASCNICDSCKKKGYSVAQTGMFGRKIMLNGVVIDDNTDRHK